MKKIFLSFLFGSLIIGVSCQNSGNPEEKKDSIAKITNIDTVKKTEGLTEKTAKYICPMKCEESFSQEPGKCPKCGMDKIENPDFVK